MAKKSNSQTGIQGLVIFKHKGSSRKRKTDKYLVEKINKEDKIKIINSLTNHGTHYRYSILLTNQNSASIADININVLYPEFLKYVRSYPLTVNTSSPIKNEQEKINIINLNIKILKGKRSEQIYLHFTPSNQVAIGEFKTSLKYKNKKGKENQIDSDSINIKVDELVISPKIISHSRIREFSQIPGIHRALVSFGIGTNKKLNLKKILDILENLVLSKNFQFITKDKEKGIFWFCGSELNTNNDILILSKIGLNFIEIIAYSINPIILSLFLNSFTKNLKDQLAINKIIKSNMEIFELECVNCGDTLPYFPKKGESITCLKCSYEQIVW